MPMKLEIYGDKSGKSRWRLKSSNGQTIAAAGQAFASRSSAKRSAEAFKANAAKNTFEVYEGRGGGHRWRAVSSNGQTVASGGEKFEAQASARRAATNVQKNVGKASVE